MTLTTTVGYVLAGLIAAAIIFIGARFLVAPRVAAAGYGVPQISASPPPRAYLSVKGVRDIASGLFVIILMAAGATHLLGWVILAATIIPLADASHRARQRRLRSRSPGESMAAPPPSCSSPLRSCSSPRGVCAGLSERHHPSARPSRPKARPG